MNQPACCNGDGPGYWAHTKNCDTIIDWCSKTERYKDCPVRGRDARHANGERVPLCPIDAWVKAMVDAGVADRHGELILANLLGDPLDGIPMEVGYALVEKKPHTFLHDAKPGTTGTQITVTGSEVLVAMVGSRGVGKTLAASYVIANLGGRIVSSYRFARPGLEMDPLIEQRGALVIDQLGREYAKSDWSLAQLEEVIVERHARRRLTLLVANMTREQFARYEGVIEDRFNEDGAFVVIYGQSRRGAP